MRTKIDLSVDWTFKTDPTNSGMVESWYSGKISGGKNVKVPHIWQSEGGDLVPYSGAAWYQLQVKDIKTSQGKNWHLCFMAVDYQCDVWWNGNYIGFHEGGFTPFDFLIPNNLLDNRNQITVRVYDFPDNAEIPIGKQGSWYTRVSGIWQGVYLEQRPETFVENVFVKADIDLKQVELSAIVTGNTDLIHYEIRPHSLKEDKWEDGIVYSGTIENSSLKTIVEMPEMRLWSPAEPYLYELDICVKANGETDHYSTVFGCRNVEYKDGKVYLNHEPIYIRGALDQAFYPETIYSAPSESYIKKEIELAKQMGFNLLRKHIKVEIPEYLYWADRLGMLIWAEPPNYVKWTEMATKRFTTVLKEMIERDYNHPSIIIWSIYNEEWGLEWDLEFDTEKQAHVAEFFSEVKQWDTTRLVCDNSGWTHVNTDINDHHRYFVVPDQIDGWRSDLDDYVIGQKDRNFVSGYGAEDQPIIISEFGVWGLPDVDKLKDFYNGNEPWWFINQGEATHQDDYKRPTTLFENFSKFGISHAFENTSDLAVHSQNRMTRAVKSLIEEMRKRPEIAGYVVTEFTDIEWETNGWLDFMRNPKEGFEELVNFNGETVIMAGLPKHNYQSGESAAWDLYIASEELSGEALIKWRLEMGCEVLLHGEVPVVLNSFLHLPEVVCLEIPNVKQPVFALFSFELWVEDRKVAVNKEELTLSQQSQAAALVHVQHKRTELHEALKGVDLRADADVVISDMLDRETLEYVRAGGKVIFLAEDGDAIPHKGDYTFRELDPGESWARSSSMNYVNTAWLEGLPVHPEMGWEFEFLFPDYVVPFTDYKKVGQKRTVNLFGNPSLAETAEIISGYFQGWLGQNGGSVLLQKHGKGVILTITWKLASQLNNNPNALLILNHFIEKLARGSFAHNRSQEVT
ncbi:glycoside hydrolase family 2 protein [Bacillus sp. FJAT-18017]|uniref:glycoside hydrolase family 2 protein n=1 Tax=Bacillus sp. FJAT-18017 TaxID=1705566 RepID=UPI0006AF0C00|nr:glycoside hydrolase family 2 [Bacillus sp. FJAT-18017]